MKTFALSNRTRRSDSRNPRRSARGMVLIEVLVSALIFAFGVLGVVGLQAHLKRSESLNRHRVIATASANELIGSMWADPANLTSFATPGCSGYAICNAWLTRVASALPSGTAAITVNNVVPAPGLGADVQVVLTWTTPDGTQQLGTSSSIRLR